jgi:hypothetical protein
MIGITLAARWSARSTISATAFWRALANLWIPERNATRLSGCQGFRSVLADKRAFFLRKRREQVQDEGVNVRAEISDQERHPHPPLSRAEHQKIDTAIEEVSALIQ